MAAKVVIAGKYTSRSLGRLPKLLNINDITKRIGNFFKLPIQLSWGIAYPELAL